MLQSQSFMLFSRCMFAAVKAAVKEKQHKYPVTGMTMGPCAIFVKEYFAKNSPKNLSEGRTAMREAAAAWKSLDETTRKKYEDLSKRYRDEKIHEFERLSDEEKNEMITASLKEKEEKARRRIRKERRERWESTGHPERPPTAYNLFVQEKFNELKERGEMVAPVVKTMTSLSVEWKSMSDSAKKPYVTKATRLLEEYKSKVDEWKAKQSKEVGT
ncbi:hypothetical protein KIN20_028173 [Parelaphostrongylus tenuis]|uniref:HMG box domain-containing protein n=1 Tax=Parelaphostrongylus tenuis TaxID=148309 RepID=A0AAD5R0D5_PARTN|nr:hypothetical protein KIN20_028173 [Parelaphostrongylus tenuis]